MNKPDHVIEIFLQPGEFYFGDANTRIRTILGSCVSITMWHPTRLIGGMCHFLLPSRPRDGDAALDGRYADEAMQMFLQEIRAARTHPAEYRVKVFGGGNMFRKAKREDSGKAGRAGKKPEMDVAGKNVLVARSLIDKHGFRIDAEDLGGNGHRQLLFDIWSGHVWLRKPPMELL
jgi:chemotaxis protein CheD